MRMVDPAISRSELYEPIDGEESASDQRMSKRLTGYSAGLVSNTDATVEQPVEIVEEKRQHKPSTF